MCDYYYRNGSQCPEKSIYGSKFCPLHTPFPDDVKSSNYLILFVLKYLQIQTRLYNDNFYFEGAIINFFSLDNIQTHENINLIDSNIIDRCVITDSKISGNICLSGARIGGGVFLLRDKIGGNIDCSNAIIDGDMSFQNLNIEQDVDIQNSVLKNGFYLYECIIRGDISINQTNIFNDLIFCDKVKIGKNISLNKTQIYGFVYFCDVSVKDRVKIDYVKVSVFDDNIDMRNQWREKEYHRFDDGKIIFRNSNFGYTTWINHSQINKDIIYDKMNIGSQLHIFDSKVDRNILFIDSFINNIAHITCCEIKNDISFDGGGFGDSVKLALLKIEGNISFDNSDFKDELDLGNNIIKKSLSIIECTIAKSLDLSGSQTYGDARFSGSLIKNDMELSGLKVYGDVFFNYLKLYGNFLIDENAFHKSAAQEEGYRKAKILHEELGDREKADFYFVKEMRACREKKLHDSYKYCNPFHQIKLYLNHPFILLERIFIDGIFKFGTNWKNVIVSWFILLIISAILFWHFILVESVGPVGHSNSSGFVENLYFSIQTITTLSYGDFQPKPGFAWFVSGIVAIFGTFIWAAFITIFARKYMR